MTWNGDIQCGALSRQGASAYSCSHSGIAGTFMMGVDSLPYSPNFTLNDYHLFTYLKNWFE